MLIKFICWLFCHKFKAKAFTGNNYEYIDPLTQRKGTGKYFIWEQQKYCSRCNTKNPNYEGKN